MDQSREVVGGRRVWNVEEKVEQKPHITATSYSIYVADVFACFACF